MNSKPVALESLHSAVDAFDLAEHRERLLDRQRDVELGLVVMVVGEGNFGKSSLVNALCGRVVAPVAVIPKTFKIDAFVTAESDRALVRSHGQRSPDVLTHREAHELSQAAETAIKRGEGSRLAEIIWMFQDLALPKGIALVDTPGISQALAGSAKGISLTQVLGSSFEVDEVWAHWFHRADVVVWGFCSNKLQSAETKKALEGALRLFDKRIIPVATKADFVTKDRWQEIHEQFQRIYEPLLADRECAPLHLTVCGGSHLELRGSGIPQLRAELASLLGESVALKNAVLQEFVRDECATVSTILETTAKQLVTNLRSIASLGDNLANEAEKEADRATHRAVSSITSYFHTIRAGNQLGSLAQEIHLSTHGGRKGDIESEARRGLARLVDPCRIQKCVEEAFTEAGASLEAMAARLSAAADVGRATFKSSGQVIRKPVTLNLELRAVRFASSLPYIIRLNYPKGFLSNVLDLIKGLFGAERFSVGDIQKAMAGALAVDVEDLRSSRDKALFEGYAPAIRDAVNRALQIHLDEADAQAIRKLKLVDIHLPVLSGKEGEQATTFGPQGEYWATLSPKTETLLNLAREELTKILPEFRSLVSRQFEYSRPHRFETPKNVWENSRSAVEGESPRWRILPKSTVVSVSVHLGEAIRRAYSRESFQEAGKTDFREIEFRSHVISKHLRMLEGSSLSRSLDSRLADCTVGVRYRSAGERLAKLGSQSLIGTLDSSRRSWDWSVVTTRFCGTNVALWAPGVMVTWLFVGATGMLWKPVIGLGSLMLAVITWSFGAWFPYLSFRLAYTANIPGAVSAEISSCLNDAQAQVPQNAVDLVVEGMTAELAPRPLQVLLRRAGLLRG